MIFLATSDKSVKINDNKKTLDIYHEGVFIDVP
jgi:hypothetical protein